MLVRSVAEVLELAASPAGVAALPEVLVVDLRGAGAVDLSPLRGLPRVLVGIAPDPIVDLDVLVPDESAAERIVAAVTAYPLTTTSLVLHLRSSEELGIDDGLIAESATYSMLQAGPEHQRWLADRSPRAKVRDDGARVRVTRDAGGLHIALARVEVRNAVDGAMQQALVDALACAGGDEPIFLTGDGPVFSAGGDLDEFGTLADPASAHLLRLARSPARALAGVASRTTVLVQGACHGAGVELPAFASRVVAREDTTFTLPEVGLGLIPGAGGTVSLPRRIGRHRTAWLAITGEPIDAATALAWGLVDEITERSPTEFQR